MSDIHQRRITELLRALDTSELGLTGAEAARRLRHFGLNELRVRQSVPEIVKFLRQFKNFFAILLLVGGALALLAERLDPGQGNFYIACALVGVTVLNAVFTYIQEHQSELIMASFRKMLPTMVMAYRDGEVQRIQASRLVPGDVMLLYEGDKIPADGRLLDQNAFQVDLSSLTGESDPVKLNAEQSAERLLDSPNMVFSGTLVQNGDARVLVCMTGMHTQIGKIVKLTKETLDVETPIHRELKHFIKIISAIAIFLGVLFFLVSVAIGKGAIGSLIFAIGIIVANVPEGLLPTVTLALTMASKRMAAKKALIKNLESVETLGSTTVICTDKTGTLTQNKLSVVNLWIDQKEHAAADLGAADEHEFTYAWRIMALCNNAHLSGDGYSGDATEGALLVYADRMRPIRSLRPLHRVFEQPFDSSSKRMMTVYEIPSAGQTRCEAYLKGAPEVVMSLCDRIILDREIVSFDDARRQMVNEAYRKMASRGERGLALAFREGEDSDVDAAGFVFVAITGMLDPPRPEVTEAIARCRSAGIRVAMLTGDYGVTALSIAKQIGLVGERGRVVRGDELEEMDDARRQELLQTPELVFARISPRQKLEIVRAYQANGEVVTVTGDGVNDSPALKNADMGVAMGVSGTEVAKEASDMVLMDDNFATIVAAVEEGRTIFDNIKKFIAYILTSNVPEILPFIAYVLLDIPLPLTVVLILAIDLGTDIVPALGLGAEAPETDVMRKPPRRRDERLLTPVLLGVSYGIVGVMQAAAGFFSFFVILHAGGWSWGTELAASAPLYRTAVTGFFASIIICQVADVVICRTRRQSLVTVGVFSNRLVLLGIATELTLLALIAYVPACNVFFGTAPLAPWQLALSVPFAVLILLGDELRRLLVRRGNRFVLRYLTW